MVVVGAGLSGLVAARSLRRAGLTVRVLEAADRCGGRAMSETTALGSRVDLGGQWLGHDHHRLAALAAEQGCAPYVMESSALPPIIEAGRRISPLTLLGGITALLRLEAARRLRPDGSTAAAETWLARAPRRSRRLLEVVAAISWTTDLDRISVATLLGLIRAQHGLVTMLSSKGGAQDSLLPQGIGTLVDALVVELGDVVRTGSAVTRVVRDEAGAEIHTAARVVRARRVVVTVPPPVAARITHEPVLPADRADLERSTFMGSVYKAIAVYPEPFWRGTTKGELMLLDRPGVAVFDTTAPGGPGHLCLLVGGRDAESLDDLTTEERRGALLARIAERLGPRALEPAGWHEKSWHLDLHAGGGYMALPALDSAHVAIPVPSDPVGTVHWGGSETATDHPGYLDGAIESGERVAAEVVAALSR